MNHPSRKPRSRHRPVRPLLIGAALTATAASMTASVARAQSDEKPTLPSALGPPPEPPQEPPPVTPVQDPDDGNQVPRSSPADRSAPSTGPADEPRPVGEKKRVATDGVYGRFDGDMDISLAAGAAP